VASKRDQRKKAKKSKSKSGQQSVVPPVPSPDVPLEAWSIEMPLDPTEYLLRRPVYNRDRKPEEKS
jgi:hypothetical protein